MPKMQDDPQEALAILARGVSTLLRDKELAQANPAERALVGRLQVLLNGQFPGWSIDIEWNRREDVVKRLRHGLTEDQLVQEGAIVPDLIVHRIGKRENLLVVEVKRAGNRLFEGDIWKLRGMTKQDGAYGYAAGVHLVLDMPAGAVGKSDVYVDGEMHGPMTAWMREQLP